MSSKYEILSNSDILSVPNLLSQHEEDMLSDFTEL